MQQKKIDKIKAAIKGNFDQSPTHYQEFEEEYRFFRQLNEKLLQEMNPPAGAHILDVGCGTGASCRQILDAVPDSRVWGLDISPEMLELARSVLGDSERLDLVEGDGAQLATYFNIQFDTIVYSASVFLIPDFQESLRQAQSLLKSGGAVGLTFMQGLYGADGTNLVAEADQKAKQGVSLRKPVDLSTFRSFFEEMFPRSRSWNEDLRLPLSVLRRFYSIPAMSAGLFPGIEYDERVKKVARVFDQMPQRETIFRWVLMVGRRSE